MCVCVCTVCVCVCTHNTHGKFIHSVTTLAWQYQSVSKIKQSKTALNICHLLAVKSLAVMIFCSALNIGRLRKNNHLNGLNICSSAAFFFFFFFFCIKTKLMVL